MEHNPLPLASTELDVRRQVRNTLTGPLIPSKELETQSHRADTGMTADVPPPASYTAPFRTVLCSPVAQASALKVPGGRGQPIRPQAGLHSRYFTSAVSGSVSSQPRPPLSKIAKFPTHGCGNHFARSPVAGLKGVLCERWKAAVA